MSTNISRLEISLPMKLCRTIQVHIHKPEGKLINGVGVYTSYQWITAVREMTFSFRVGD
jgi:hypothetical protein